MTDEIDKLKQRADELVSSYGLFELSTKMDEAVQRVAELWSLDEIELQLLRPRKAIAASNAVKLAADTALGTAKGKATFDGAGQAARFASFARANGASGVKQAAGTAARAGLTVARNNKIALAVAAVGTAVAAGGLSAVTHRELKAFNERCYSRRRGDAGEGEGAPA